jgi:hypothetical protein
MHFLFVNSTVIVERFGFFARYSMTMILYCNVKLTSAVRATAFTAFISLHNFAVGRAGVYLPYLTFCCF